MIKNHHFARTDISSFQKPKKGQICCGDSYFFIETNDYFICVLVDGLGSGEEAKQASERAISVVREHHDEDVDFLMSACNKELRVGRGAVLSMFKIKFDAHELIFSGVGNVRFIFYSPDRKKVTPIPTLGFLAGKPIEPKIQVYPFESGSSFALYSDGLEMNVGHHSLFSDTSPEVATSHIQHMVMKDESIQDDVTFLYGKITAEEVK